MMYIAKCHLDKRGRITIPLSFFKANKMKPEEYIARAKCIPRMSNSIHIIFTHEGDEDE